MNTRKIPALRLFFILIILSGCTTGAEPSDVPLTPVTVQLSWTHLPQFAGMYAADQKGFYDEEGLAVTFVEGGANVDKLTPVLDGTAQFGVASADELLLARSEGKLFIAVATIFRRSPVAFMSLAEKGITSPQDFAGKTIRTPANIAPTLHAMLARVGITRDQYTIVDLPADLTMFASGDVPVWGVFTTGFVVAVEQAGYKVNLIYPDDYGVHFYSDTLYATDELIAANPDLALRFVRATLKGWTYAVENSVDAAVLVQKYNPTADPTIEIARMTASLPLINTGEDHIGWMKPEVWADMEETLREQSVLTAPLDVTQVYTMQFIEEIYK